MKKSKNTNASKGRIKRQKNPSDGIQKEKEQYFKDYLKNKQKIRQHYHHIKTASTNNIFEKFVQEDYFKTVAHIHATDILDGRNSRRRENCITRAASTRSFLYK